MRHISAFGEIFDEDKVVELLVESMSSDNHLVKHALDVLLYMIEIDHRSHNTWHTKNNITH